MGTTSRLGCDKAGSIVRDGARANDVVGRSAPRLRLRRTLPTGGLALAMRRSVASAEKLTATGLAKRATHSTMTVRYEKP